MSNPTMQLTSNEVQILGAILGACKQGMQAELIGGRCPADRAAFLSDGIKVCDKFLGASGGATPSVDSRIITPPKT